VARPFCEILGEISGGMLASRLSDELADLSAAVAATSKAGTLTLTVKLTPNGVNSVFVTGDVKAKAPADTMPKSIFFTTSSGDLLRNDPDQPELPNIRAVVGIKGVK